MKLGKLAIAAIATLSASFAALVAQAGGWDDFKLRYANLTSVFHDQRQELDDLRKQSNRPEVATRIELEQLLNGGPPKDGIPSLDAPQFDTAATTPFDADELAIGVIVDGEAKVYPLGILNWHEIVNDRVGGKNLSITYCPLCDTVIVFERGNTTFGVSGKLYHSCLVMYDRADDSLYSQPWGLGIVGPQVNQSLTRYPAVKTTLGAWLDQHPDSQILSTDTGHDRDYQRYPYGSYYTNEELVFPARNQAQRELHPKAIVSYIWAADAATPHNQFSGASHQFPHQELRQVGEQVVEFDGREVRAVWDDDLATIRVTELDGTPIPSATAFAFVYPAYFGTP